MTTLPENLRKIRDEAAQKHWLNLNPKLDHAELDFKEGFNKCYEVMAEELKQECYRSGEIEANRDFRYQQQLAEKDKLLSECREALEYCFGDAIDKDRNGT